MNPQKHIDSLNRYIKEYPSSLPFEAAELELFKNDPKALDAAIDFIIDLFAKIGVGEDLSPSMDGIILDSCLEFLTDLREEFNS